MTLKIKTQEEEKRRIEKDRIKQKEEEKRRHQEDKERNKKIRYMLVFNIKRLYT